MKYLKVIIEPFKIKGDLDDPEQLQQDILERVMAMVESETLAYSVDDEDSEEDSDF